MWRTVMRKSILPLAFIIMTACATANYVSQITVSDLDAVTYKQVDSKNKIVGMYFYHSKFPTADGDMTMKAIMDAMAGKVEFYKVNLKGFSLEEGNYVSQNVIGGKVLPSYVFFNNGKVVVKVNGGKSSPADAHTLASSLYQGFESRNWMRDKKLRKR